MKTYYEIEGKGEPIIFIHGGFVSSKMWRLQREYFKNNYQVITYDIRGHGKTGSSELKSYSVELFAADLKDLIEELKIAKVIICGLSLGGMIAQTFAVFYGDKVEKLILADAAASTCLNWWDKLTVNIFYPKWLILPYLRFMGVNSFVKLSFWLAKYTLDKKWLGKNNTVEYELEEIKKLDKKEYSKILGAVYDFRLQAIEEIKVPTLIINGEFESKSVISQAKLINRKISQSQMVTIPNAGHTSNLDNPEEFNRVVESFLISP